MNNIKLSLFILLSMSWLAASTVRIMTYNLLNFQDENDREDDFVAIIDFVEPDLIIAEEIVAQTGFSHFKSDVLDVLEPDAWSSATFTNQSASQDIALFYRHDHFTFISTDVVYTAQSSGTRDVIEWIMVHNQSSVQFNVYGVHFKASSGESNAQERLQEATILRTYLNNLNENYFIVAGDFNIYSNSSSSEPAFDMLTGNANNNNGRLFDPIDRIGPWHSNSSYADVHTQSTCNHESGHNGGANGGLDDRFDWLFVSEVILDTSSEMRYVENTYWAVGNDGDHHNKSINFGNNSSVSDAIADALHDASDHLPVYMDVWFDDLTYNDAGIVITEIMPNPGAVSDSYGEWIEIHNTTDSTIDIEGWMIKDAGSDEHVISNDAMSILVVPGDYFILARNGNEALNGGLVADYAYTGFTLSNSEDEIILTNAAGAIVDEVHYTNAWIFGNGIAMEIHDLESNNNVAENWYASTVQYGDGDYGTPGTDWQGTVGIDEKIGIAETFLLHPPYPNPFNPVITIRYTIPVSGQYAIHIYSVTGRLIKTLIDNHFSAGHYAAKWDASGLASGVYWLKMESVNHIQVNKITLVQ